MKADAWAMLSELTTEDMDNRELPILLVIVDEDRFVKEILKILISYKILNIFYLG